MSEHFDGPVPPHDPEAEQAVLGACMLSPKAAAYVTENLLAADFYRPAHETIFLTMLALLADGKPCDAVTVLGALGAEISRVGGAPYLHTLVASPPAVSNVNHYVTIIQDRSMLRSTVQISNSVTQAAYHPGRRTGLDVVEHAIDKFTQLRKYGLAFGGDEPIPTLTQFLDADDDTYDWIVPHLLERGDRLILTGNEGAGKSTLARQIAVGLCAGLHPITLASIRPGRALLVDCENPETLLRRQLRRLRICCRSAGVTDDLDTLFVKSRPDGLDLTTSTDTRWLTKVVDATTPDLLVIGPLYKLHAANPNDEEPARTVAKVLDSIRTRYRCGLVMEAHPGHARDRKDARYLRPAGASLWMRWPEFGYGLSLDHDDDGGDGRLRQASLKPWRGAREGRDFPERLVQGTHWPWVVNR